MKVLVTGAGGFIAGHCVRELLEHGHTVRGTVRDASATERYAHLRELGEVELVSADLTDDAGWAEAMAGCEGVLHTASPFFISEDEADLVGPAVEGTRRVLAAAAAAGVKRVVVTSSTASIINTDAEVYTEAQWSEPERCAPYAKSKTLAERAAWDFVEAQPEDGRLELVTCNPCLVLGPLQHDKLSTSIEPIRRLLARELPAVPRLGFSMVDVRDVAIAHRLALETPEAAGNRYLLMSGHLWMQEMSQILKEALGDQGFRPPTLPLPYWVLWLVARFDTSVRSILGDVGKHLTLDSSKAREELGWSPRPVQESVIDTGRSLVERGRVKPR